MPTYPELQAIRNFKSLIRYLRTQLDWPVDEEQVEDLTFDYDPEDLGLDAATKVKLREIKQIRPLDDKQPWGVFWVDFEPKRLPVVVLRRILGALAASRRKGRGAQQKQWVLQDLMFISATGQGNERGVTFAHFRQVPGTDTPQLRTFSWDVQETHLYYIQNLNLAALRWPADPEDTAAWRSAWASAFPTAHRAVIRTSEALAQRLAEVANVTRHRVNEAYTYERPHGALHKLYAAFKKALIHDLSVDDFADMYAQTVAYGLFSAAATPHTGTLTLENVVGLIPQTNPFLRELFAECLRVSQGTRRAQIDLDELGVGELLETLQATDIDAVLRDWGLQRRGEDPVIHFYETFLRQYDAEKKTARGVFYTPNAVVSFIVRSVDHLLRTEFGCKDGLATATRDEARNVRSAGFSPPTSGEAETTNNFRVEILDPATGTGTFLKYVIDQIYDNFNEKHKRLSAAERKKRWNEYVPTQLLPRLYGFELLMAPYTVAHMKLGLALKQTEYEFGSDERLRVFLANSLNEEAVASNTLDTMQWLAQEANSAAQIKRDTPITVILGNPPYSALSANMSDWIDGLLKGQTPNGKKVSSYYEIDDKPLGEKKVWLQDDYVKFIRYGQWLIDRTGEGILAYITNHSYLDNPTFRGMRQSLMRSFSEIYLLDLHGNQKKKELAPDGSADKNVFDIQQGVAIGFFIKKRSATNKVAKVFHADLWGTREHKYEQLLLTEKGNVVWQELSPSSPYYLFIPHSEANRSEYESGWKITEAMPENVNGIVTARDHFVVDFDQASLLARINKFADPKISDTEIRKMYFKL